MKKYQLLFIACFTIHCFFIKAQLSGSAFLAGQTDHSGIKVKFNAHSGTSVSDSAVTNASGNYTINIVSGVYDVVFSRQGYLTSFYNSGGTVLLTNTVVLNTVTLSPGNEVFVSGEVYGNWTSNNIYIVTGDLTVPYNSVLIIQPGTSVKFNGYYSLTANGALIASGSPTGKILFTSNVSAASPINWNTIQIKNRFSVIDHCIVEYCDFGLSVDGFRMTISNSIFRNISTMAITCTNSNSHIFNNEVYNLVNNNGNASIGIGANGGDSIALIECNHVYSVSAPGWNAYGIRAFEKTETRNNIVHNITGSTARGIEVGPTGNIKIKNNYVYNCEKGIEMPYQTTSPYPVINNNTLDSNTIGIYISEAGSYAHIVNNIIVNNQYGILQNGWSAVPEISHNLVWGNSGANYQSQVTGIGQTVANNSQGNPVDSYYNLSQDPLFAGGTPPLLSPGSPCINSGDSLYSPNIGMESSSACQQNGITTSLKPTDPQNLSISIFPNPSQDKFTVEASTSEKLIIQLYDLSGRLLLSRNSTHSATIDISSLQEGVYSLTIKTDKALLSKKLVVVR